jgi:hypothetical protein
MLREPPACLVIADMKGTGSPSGNIQDLPVAPFLYGFSVSVCMSAALSAQDGLGLGTLGFSEVSRHSLLFLLPLLSGSMSMKHTLLLASQGWGSLSSANEVLLGAFCSG